MLSKGSALWAKKPASQLLQEAGGHGLRAVLGPLQLTSLGVGAIIGAGIFVIIGVVAKDKAGAATMLSFVLAGSACAFAALCYAEFAAMVPVAGSAYTYAYATLGELFAWIIGWDLLLEYGVGAASVAHGWSHYFVNFLVSSESSCRRRSPILLSISILPSASLFPPAQLSICRHSAYRQS